jgi:hypothetical protein
LFFSNFLFCIFFKNPDKRKFSEASVAAWRKKEWEKQQPDYKEKVVNVLFL